VKRKKILQWVKLVVVIYCLVGILGYFLQDKFIMHPKPLPPEYVYRFDQPFKELNIRIDQKNNINIIQFPVSDTVRKGVVLYFHGNMDNINHYAAAAKMFNRNQYDVWMIDYPGFGKTTGYFTEERLYSDAMQFYKMAKATTTPDSIIIYGRSLGTGIATQLASVRDCRRLILETPYNSLTSLAAGMFWMYPVKWTIKYKMPTNEYLRSVSAPVSIFHGTSDNVIPYTNAAKLKAVLKPSDAFITIPGGHHNDLPSFPQFNHNLDSLLHN